MSQQEWGQLSKGAGGGSVKRARERLEAGLPPELPEQPPQQRPYDPTRQAPSPPSNRSRPQMPQALQGQGPIGVAISRPTQVPQWPLAGTIERGSDQIQQGNQQYQPPAGRGAPPQRPPRPSNVPSMLDASRLQEHTPSFQYQPPQDQEDQAQERGLTRYEDEETQSPSITSPLTQSSRQSTISSVGTIPDFPIAMSSSQPGHPRRSANLGPPPSSRRGASSYYSQASFVSPIPEESPRVQPSHDSYASSAAMPTSWGSDSPGYQDEDEDDYERHERERGWANDTIEEGRESRESTTDDGDDQGLIRSASLGKRAKPSMITTKSSEKIDPQQRPNVHPQQRSKLERMGVVEGGMPGVTRGEALTAEKLVDGQRDTIWPVMGNPSSPLAGGTGLIDKSNSSSENDVSQVSRTVVPNNNFPLASGPDASAIMGAYDAASSLQPPGITPARTPSPGFSRLSAIRRPPRLDIDAVRDAEARGSLTSLPDLIRRATRLAAMIDGGRRPASRINDLNDFSSMSDFARDKETALSPLDRRQSGFSGMLAAFPPPGLATPTRGNTPRPRSSWPVFDASNSPQDLSQSRKKRRCCGLPCWGLILILLILLIIVAAAVVIPLELLVLHKPKSSTTTALTPLEACSQNNSTACQNGGTSTLSTGSCSCICINVFTGSTCSTAGASGCTTTTLSSDPSYPNVTLGDSIPRLIDAAQTNFSIPLFSTLILARFNAGSLSCVAENALVTFDGQSTRQGSANLVVTPVISSTATSSSSSNKRRQDASSSTSAASAAATKNGIVYDPSPASTSTASSSTASATTDPSAVFGVTELVLDFARVSVLFILQEEALDAAVAAQSALQHFFSLDSSTNAAAQNVSLGNGNTADLLAYALDLGNGSVGAYNASATRRSLNGRRSVDLWTVDGK